MSQPPRAILAPRRGVVVCAALVLVAIVAWAGVGSAVAASDASDAENLRVRIAWGGGAAVQWEGAIELSDGEISQVLPLGVDPDETGSMHNDGRRLRIRQRGPRSYDGVDFLASALADATVTIRLMPVANGRRAAEDALQLGDDGRGAFAETIPLAKLVSEIVDLPIGEDGQRVLLMRSPGDALRVEFDAKRDSLVFSPGEILELTVRPHRMAIEAGTKLRFRAQLNHARGGGEVWSKEDYREVAAGGNTEAWPLSIQLPEQAGVYDVQITAHAWGLRERILDPTKRIGLGAPLVSRTVQLVVFDGRATDRGTDRAAVEPPAAAMQAVVELDP
ncbi:MAG: hypothetical protein WD875_08530, partial [Pirellulales bacterium]